jgi:hypothetical protein
MRIGFEWRARGLKFVAAMVWVGLFLHLPSQAQYRSSSAEKKTSPRALAVIQQLPGGSSRLFPVSIFLDGKFYDARFYYAKPVPLALFDETVYEALSDGMPVGEFTVHTAKQVPETTTWWGEGEWRTLSTNEDKPKPAPGSNQGRRSDDRPVLKRPSANSSDNPSSDSSSSGKSQASSNSSEPTMKPDNDSDRPVLRKPKEAKPEPQVTEATGEVSHVGKADADPNRPVLRRKQPVEKDEGPVTITAPKSGIKGAKYVVAISDPDPMNNRPYDYPWSASEQAKWTEQMSKLAMEAVRRYAGTESRAQLLTTAKFADTQLRAVDLDYSNAPYLVFTGRIDPTIQPTQGTKSAQRAAPPQLATFYVTVVARLNSQDQLTRLLAVATDSLHLDLNPRLELIDAVDADGDNRAELLFRKTTESGGSYVLYRMTPFDMTKIFEGGSGN